MYYPDNSYDNRGKLVEVGDRVCYNFQGEIEIGTVEKIQFDDNLRPLGFLIKPDTIRSKSELSKVKRSKNLMVIYE